MVIPRICLYILKRGEFIIVGIYMFKNKLNGKIYVGQSNNIERRYSQHKRATDNMPFHKAVRKYGIDNFKFRILKECEIDELNRWEIYYISKCNSLVPHGYNVTKGGNDNSHLSGENNPNSKLTVDIVWKIREYYATDITKGDVYEKFKDLISINTFADVWNGKTWKNVHYDVYSVENRLKHKYQKGRKHCHIVDIKDVIFIRDCKNRGMLKSDVKDKFYPDMNINTFSDIWYYNTLKNIKSDLPQTPCDFRKQYKKISGVNNRNSVFSEKDVITILNAKNKGVDKKIIRNKYKHISKQAFNGLWSGKHYKDLYKQICNDYS